MSEFSARDDSFHFDVMSDRWLETETAWFSFCQPERKLGGWLYSMFRPNIGTVAGGCWIWDAGAHLPWEVLYSTNYSALRIPGGQDLTDISLPTGVSIKALEPLTRYRLGYHDDERLSLDLTYESVMAPRALHKADSSFTTLNHFDQFGRVSGEITLHGERIAIDCISMRDRSWGPRPEHRPGKSAYVTGVASAEDAFLAVTKWNDETDPIAYGFMIRDGETADLVSGRRIVERDSAHGWVKRITIEGRDDRGRELFAVGERLSGIVVNRHSLIDSNGLIAWTINGKRDTARTRTCGRCIAGPHSADGRARGGRRERAAASARSGRHRFQSNLQCPYAPFLMAPAQRRGRRGAAVRDAQRLQASDRARSEERSRQKGFARARRRRRRAG